MKQQSMGWRALFTALAWSVRALAQDAPPASDDTGAPAPEPTPGVGNEADASAEPAPAPAPVPEGPAAPAPPSASPAPSDAVPAPPAETSLAPVVPAEERTEPGAVNAPPLDDNDGSGSDDGPDYPRFRPSLRVMTGFEWTREQRFATTGRLDSQEYGFFLSQVRAQLEAKLTKRIEAEVSAELADAYDAGVVSTSDRPLYLRDAYLNIRAKRYLQLRAGHFKRPISALEHRNAGDLQVRGRGLTNDLIIEDNAWGGRGLGAQLWGKFKAVPLVWSLGAFDPIWAPSSASRPKGMDLLGRVAIEPIDGLTLGVNGGMKSLDTPPYDKYETFFGGGGDVEFESHGFFLLVDGLYAQLPLPASNLDSQTAFGVVALISYDVRLTPQLSLQPVLLGEYSDSSTDHADSETVRGVVGVNGIIDKNLRIMPQVEVVDWLGDPSELSPKQSLTAYLMLSLAL